MNDSRCSTNSGRARMASSPPPSAKAQTCPQRDAIIEAARAPSAHFTTGPRGGLKWAHSVNTEPPCHPLASR